jgi:hypothetical protein
VQASSGVVTTKAGRSSKSKGPRQSSLRAFVQSSTASTPRAATPQADPDLARAIAASLAEQGGVGVSAATMGRSCGEPMASEAIEGEPMKVEGLNLMLKFTRRPV